MSRPEGHPQVGGPSCVRPAGESPVAVIAGEPRSRLRTAGEILTGERSVESPHGSVRVRGGEQSCGPSIKRALQPRDIGPRKGGTAEPVMSRRRQQTARVRTGAVQDVPGVRRRARSDGLTRNRRGPPRRPPSGAGAAHKPRAKGRRVERESEGSIVPVRFGESRAEGRGPALVALVHGGKGEGMA
jgi:hypothetical protein